MKSLATASTSLLAVSLAACVSQGHPAPTQAGVDATEDYRISVEIPLEELQVAEAEILKVNELLAERTGFNAEDFQLDEVVLIARSDAEGDANAELLVLEWRSGQVAIPPGGEDDWFEVRVPAPDEDNGGAWLLDITGAATVNLLVAVLEPRPAVVEKIAHTKTVYRTRTVYRDRAVYPRSYHSYWIYEPSRYYTVHYHGIWPYRYFIGPWDSRYYDLAYRPYRYHYGPIYRSHRHSRPGHSYGNRRARDAHGRSGAAVASRRISADLVRLRRDHPRLRVMRQRQEPRRPGDATARFEEAKRTHPRLRAFHNPERRRQTSPGVTGVQRTGEPRQPDAGDSRPRAPASQRNAISRRDVAPQRRNTARPAVPPSNPRSRALRRPERNATAPPQPPTAQRRSATRPAAPPNIRNRVPRQAERRAMASPRPPVARRAAPTPSQVQQRPPSNVRTQQLRRASSAVQPTRQRSVQPTRTNARMRSFERQPRAHTAPARVAPRTPTPSSRQPSRAAQQRSSAPAAERPTRSNPRRPAFERRLGR